MEGIGNKSYAVQPEAGKELKRKFIMSTRQIIKRLYSQSRKAAVAEWGWYGKCFGSSNIIKNMMLGGLISAGFDFGQAQALSSLYAEI